MYFECLVASYTKSNWTAKFRMPVQFSRKGYNCTSLTAATHKGMYDDVGGGGVMRVRG